MQHSEGPPPPPATPPPPPPMALPPASRGTVTIVISRAHLAIFAGLLLVALLFGGVYVNRVQAANRSAEATRAACDARWHGYVNGSLSKPTPWPGVIDPFKNVNTRAPVC